MKTYRHLFDIPDEVAYFNCAGNSPQLKESTRRLEEGARSKGKPWMRTPNQFFNLAEKVRELAAKTFGGDPDGYAVIPAASYGISTAARIAERFFQPGDAMLVMAEEFPSNVLPWKRVVKETGANLITVPRPVDNNWTREIIEHINEKTKVVAISPCHWTDGTLVDFVKIREICRQKLAKRKAFGRIVAGQRKVGRLCATC